MRKEASIQEWKDLYQAATIIKELKPWEHFWDMDLIGIQEGKEEDTVFFSVLGRGGGCVGYDPKSRYAGSGGGPKGSPGREYCRFYHGTRSPKGNTGYQCNSGVGS